MGFATCILFECFSVELEQIPPPGKGSLYIRPLLIGSGPVLGLAPSLEYTFLVFASPVGNYFKVQIVYSVCFYGLLPFLLSFCDTSCILLNFVQEGTAPLNLYVEKEFHRASRGGAGGVKSITNYAPVKNHSLGY